MSVLGLNSGYTVKYNPLSSGVPLGFALGNSFRQKGYIWPYIPRFVLIRIQYSGPQGHGVLQGQAGVGRVSNLISYQARESRLVPVEFLTAQFLQKLWFMKNLVLMGENQGGAYLHCFPGGKEMCKANWKEKELTFSTFLFSIQAMQRNPTLFLPSQQRLLKLRFLQKLGCKKLCWD